MLVISVHPNVTVRRNGCNIRFNYYFIPSYMNTKKTAYNDKICWIYIMCIYYVAIIIVKFCFANDAILRMLYTYTHFYNTSDFFFLLSFIISLPKKKKTKIIQKKTLVYEIRYTQVENYYA